MGKDPSFPFYANDWLSSRRIALMNLEQQGAYVRLLCYCWTSGDCSLPDDESALKQLAGYAGELKGGWQMVRDCFEPFPNQTGKLTNLRLLEIWQERQAWRAKSRDGGIKSGEARRSGTKGGSTTLGTKREPNGNSSSSSSSSILNPLKAPLEFPDGFGTEAVKESWDFWMKNKPKRYKNKATAQRALNTYCKEFETAERLVAGIDLAIAGGWQGLQVDAVNRAGNGTPEKPFDIREALAKRKEKK